MYTKCTNLNIGGLVFQNLLHIISFDALIGYKSDESIYSVSISSFLQVDVIQLGTFLTLMPYGDDNSADMTVHFLPMKKGYFGQMYNVEVSILDAILITSVYFQGDTLHFSADATIFQNYSAMLSVTANIYCQWAKLLLHINGTLSSEPSSFHENVNARVQKYIHNIVFSARIRLSEAEKNVVTRQQQLNELTVEYKNKMSALNASQYDFRIAYANLQTANHTANELQKSFRMISNTTNQMEVMLSSICEEETCSDICIPGAVWSQCYKNVSVTDPYVCKITEYRPITMTKTIFTSMWSPSEEWSTRCDKVWHVSSSEHRCFSYSTTVDKLSIKNTTQQYQNYEPVLATSTCYSNITRQLSYRCNTIVSCSQRAPDLECIARNAACRAAKKLAVDTLEQSRQSTAAVLLAYSEARQNLSIAQTKEAIARQRLSKAGESFNTLVSAYNNLLQANTSAKANYKSIVNEIANDLSLARALEENEPDELFKLSSITFNVSIESESPTELLLNFTYQKFQQYHSTLIAVDFTVEQGQNEDNIAKSLFEHAYNSHARKRSVQMSKRQLASQSNGDSSKAKCNDLVNINKFLVQLASSLQSVTIASRTNVQVPVYVSKSTYNV